MKGKSISERNEDIVKRAKEKLERIRYSETSIAFSDVRFQDPGLMDVSPPHSSPTPSGCVELKKTHGVAFLVKYEAESLSEVAFGKFLPAGVEGDKIKILLWLLGLK